MAMKNYDYDVLVIGAGIAGFVASVTARGLGQQVCIVENRKTGGNCTSFTCIPSKALIRAAHISHQIAHLTDVGLSLDRPISPNTANVMSHVRSVVQQAYEKDLPETFEQIGIKVLFGSPEFIDSYRIKLGGVILSAKKFIIATGTRPLIPPIQGIDGIDYLTNESVFELNELPESMIILGGGVDGLEYASAFGRLGVETTIVEMSPRLLPNVEKEVADLLTEYMQEDGVHILSGTKAVSFSKTADKIILDIENSESGSGQIQADAVLVTIGRKANTQDLSLENAGVNYGPKGITVDEKLRTSAPNIYACGDIVGPYQLASMAEYQGIIAATNAILPIKNSVNYTDAVFVIFTEPTVAYLGLTEEQARQKYGDRIRVYRFNYNQMRRALVDATDRGIAKLICHSNGKLLGAHLLGEAAAEVIHELQVIKALNQPLHKLYSVTHAYPTYAQALVGRASQLSYLDRMESNFLVKQVLRFWPGYDNKLALARMRLVEAAEDSIKYEAATMEVNMNAIRVSDKTCIVQMPKEVITYDEAPLWMACTQKIQDGLKTIVLDFTAVERMNSLGASMLVKLNAKTKKRGMTLLVYGLGGHYRDVFKLTGLEHAVGIYEKEADALLAAGELSTTISTAGTREHINDITTSDTANWAKPLSKITVAEVPNGATNLNVENRRAVGPVEGFGQMWEKIYEQSLAGLKITPLEAIKFIKENFPKLQPPQNRFYPSSAGIQPNEVVLFSSSTPGGPVHTGVVILYSDDESFTFVTPQGHPESGWVSFRAFEQNQGTIVQIIGLARANDPVYEMAFRLVGAKFQERIWRHVLSSLATHLGVEPQVNVMKTCVDKKMQWSQISNTWYNAQIRSLIYTILSPLRRSRKTKE
jgi:anti-anti-sigma factor